jgi:ribosomal protein S18 acetylase RimI-like enzyme
MDLRVRPAVPADEPFLWSMLFEASHAAAEGLAGPDALRAVPELARYVEGWGLPTDLGTVAEVPTADGQVTGIGAAWVRLLTGHQAGYGHVDDETPELAIAVAPGRRAGGLGTRLLDGVLDAARGRYPGVCLSVRGGNPARRLYERVGFRAVEGSEVLNRVQGSSITMVIRF